MGQGRRAALALALAGTIAGTPAGPLRAEPGVEAVPVATPSAEAAVPVESAAPAPAEPVAEPAAEPPAPPPAPTLADRVAARIEARLADPRRALDPRLPRREREGLAAFYALGAFRPLWVGEGAWNPGARSVIARLALAPEDGLDAPNPMPHPMPPERVGEDAPADPIDALAEAELRLSAAAIVYARAARGGRLDPAAQLSRLITPKLDLPGADLVLTRLHLAGGEAGEALRAYNPAHPGYRALRDRLAELRARRPSPNAPSGAPPLVRAPDGPAPRSGTREAPVRTRLALTLERTGDGASGGVLDHAALAALARPQARAAVQAAAGAALEAEIVANMERWRWLPSELGARYVIVNLPEYRVRVVSEGRAVHEARAIVGKPESPTPLFSGTMEYAVVNPSWNVPPSILKNEFLPGLARDPDYAARRGYEVVRRGNSISVRQPPGERNALGFIKFMFPNQHAVYLHDTPNRSLFSAERRAFSHGCVRVDQPFRFAETVLGAGWPTERLQAMIGRGERTIRLRDPLPVHLAYFTTYVDDAGALRSAPDIYGIDARVKAALHLGG